MTRGPRGSSGGRPSPRRSMRTAVDASSSVWATIPSSTSWSSAAGSRAWASRWMPRAAGLRTVLVERHDLAHGTSRWSSKLVHGGLRYLASGQLGIAHESAAERHLLLTRIAPHLTRAVAQVLPLYAPGHLSQGAIVGAGYGLGDGLRRFVGTPDARAAHAGSDRRRRDAAPCARRPHATTCGAPCAAGTGSSSTTRGSSWPSPGRPPGTGHPSSPASKPSTRRVSRRDFATRSPGAEVTVRARAVVSATGVWTAAARPRRAPAAEPGHAPGRRLGPARRVGRVADRPRAGVAQPVRLHAADAARSHLHRADRRARRRPDPRRAARDRGRDRHAARRGRVGARRAADPRGRDRHLRGPAAAADVGARRRRDQRPLAQARASSNRTTAS